MTQYTFARLKPEYARYWAEMRVKDKNKSTAQARVVIKHKAEYQRVERDTGVPWFVVGCLHLRESNANFKTWLHNGDPMRDAQGRPIQTVHVPAHRPLDPDVDFYAGAYDALVVCSHFNEIKDWGPERVAYISEKFNGFGYRHPDRNIPSPYLWGNTTIQKSGKFIRDGVYDETVWDTQIGTMCVLYTVMEMDEDAVFLETTDAPPLQPNVDNLPVPNSPAAHDTETNTKPLSRSKIIWGQLLGYATAVFGIIEGFFDKLQNPYALAGFVVLIGVISFAAYMVIKGRLDVNKVIKHLAAEDDTATEIQRNEPTDADNTEEGV